MTIKAAIGLLAVLSAAPGLRPAPSLAFFDQERGRDVLKRVLSKQRAVDSVRIEARPGPGGSGSWTLKVQTASSKGVKVTVLYPVSENGLVSIDDAKELKTYFPDRNKVLVQPSPYLLQPSVDWRMKLIQQNYRVSLGDLSEVSGQRVQELLLRPVKTEMPMRRMFVDTAHDVALRYVVDDDERQITVFDTKSVIFGPEARRDFGLPTAAAEADVERHEGPVALGKPSDARKDAGFVARVPSVVPYGFKVSGTYLMGKEERSYVSVRLSDGMATLSVYQWKQDRFRRSPAPESRVRDVDEYGVAYAVSAVPGDFVPEDVMRNVLEAFLTRAE